MPQFAEEPRRRGRFQATPSTTSIASASTLAAAAAVALCTTSLPLPTSSSFPAFFSFAEAGSRKAGPTLPAPPYIAHRMSAFSSDELNADNVRQQYAANSNRNKEEGEEVAAAGAGGGGSKPLLSSLNTRLGRQNIDDRDAFWRAGWQPVPMHNIARLNRIRRGGEAFGDDGDSAGGGDGHRIPHLPGGLNNVPADPSLDVFVGSRYDDEVDDGSSSSSAAAKGSSSSSTSPHPNANTRTFINFTSYSYEAPQSHKIFSLISPLVDAVHLRRRLSGASLFTPLAVYDAAVSEDKKSRRGSSSARRKGKPAEPVDDPNHPPQLRQLGRRPGAGDGMSDQSNNAIGGGGGALQQQSRMVEKWAGLCSARTDEDWCFITIGCWGSGNIGTQSKVAKAMDTVLNDYAGRDLFPSRRGGGDADGGVGEAHATSLRPCDIRFGTINGDNFYQSGILRPDTTRLVTGFELIYTSPTLLAMPWFVSLGNHDYRGDWFQQTLLMNRPVVRNWGAVGNAGPNDDEVGNWVDTMGIADGAGGASTTQLTHGKLRPLRAFDVKGKEQTFSTGRWYLPHPYYSTRPSEELVFITLDCPLLERCQNNGDANARCWDRGQQRGWLAALLETLSHDVLVKYRVIQCHYPLYANGPHVNHAWLIALIEPLMVKYGVQLYVNADNHYLQVSKKTVAGGFGGGGDSGAGVAAAPSSAGSSASDYYFVNSGGGGGYGLNHHRSDKGYVKNPFSVFDEIRNGPFFHCLRDVGTPQERLVTIVYDDDANKLYEFDVKPFVSPIAIAEDRALGEKSVLLQKERLRQMKIAIAAAAAAAEVEAGSKKKDQQQNGGDDVVDGADRRDDGSNDAPPPDRKAGGINNNDDERGDDEQQQRNAGGGVLPANGVDPRRRKVLSGDQQQQQQLHGGAGHGGSVASDSSSLPSPLFMFCCLAMLVVAFAWQRRGGAAGAATSSAPSAASAGSGGSRLYHTNNNGVGVNTSRGTSAVVANGGGIVISSSPLGSGMMMGSPQPNSHLENRK